MRPFLTSGGLARILTIWPPVKDVFSSVASKYDLMNDAMSMGVHRLWKDTFVASLNPGNAKVGRVTRCIDVAGGTGDIALRILDHARERKADRDLTIDVVDINPAMLKEGQKRFRKTMYHASERFYSIYTCYPHTHSLILLSSSSRIPCR